MAQEKLFTLYHGNENNREIVADNIKDWKQLWEIKKHKDLGIPLPVPTTSKTIHKDEEDENEKKKND